MKACFTRRDFLKNAAIGTAAVSVHGAVGCTERTPLRPNILVMVSDDMGWGQPGFQGGEIITTTHLDRLAAEGANLSQFYVQNVCTPTRSGLLTGRYPFKSGDFASLRLARSRGHVDRRANPAGSVAGSWLPHCHRRQMAPRALVQAPPTDAARLRSPIRRLWQCNRLVHRHPCGHLRLASERAAA